MVNLQVVSVIRI